MPAFKIMVALFVIIMSHTIVCRKYEECRGIDKPNMVVPSKKSCSKYIFCNGENSYEGECLAGNYFNEKEGNCDDRENVICNIEPSDDVKSIYDEDYDPNEDEIETTDESEDDDNGGGDDDGDGDKGDNGIVTDTDIDEVNENENNVVTVTQQKAQKCPKLSGFHRIKNIVNPDSCVAFYTCYNGLAIPMLCPAKMYFNEQSGKCESQMPQSCKKRHSVRLNCHKGVYDFIPHPYRCEYYFYCLNGYLMIMRCPQDFTWHYDRRTCVHKSNSNCYFEKSVIIS